MASLIKLSCVAALMLHCSSVSAKFRHTKMPSPTTVTAFPSSTANATAVASTIPLNATVLSCFIQVPDNALTAAGLATPFLLMPPCSMAVNTQQAFVEAAVIDPATGTISIYHPLVLDSGKTPAAPNVVPALPAGAVVALWFGFNGAVLSLLDAKGLDTNASPGLQGITCVNGLPGTKGDVFGQVSWCNTGPFFAAANAGIAAGKTMVPPLGTDNKGNACPSSRSFEIVDACPSDNVPTKYL